MPSIPVTAMTPQQRYYEKNKDNAEYKQANRERSRRARERKKAAKVLESQKDSRSHKNKSAVKGAKERVPTGISSAKLDGPNRSSTDDETAGDRNEFSDDFWSKSKADSPPPTSKNSIMASSRMYEYHQFLADWTAEWGPVRCWPTSIINEYEQCVAADKEKEWRVDMLGKAEQGRVVLNLLQSLFKVLPHDHREVRSLWIQGLSVAETILSGIACLEMVVDYKSGP